MLRHPSPSLVISMLSLVIALGSAGFSATGGNFILGQANTATTQSTLTSHLNNKTLQVTNQLGTANATALGLTVAAGRPPMTVNSVVKVVNLNADRLDGLDSASLTNRRLLSFNLAAGALSAPIGLPAKETFVIAATLTPANRGIGSATILSAGSSGIMMYGGMNSCCNVVDDTHVGGSTVSGSRIIVIDGGALVELQVNDLNSLRVHNKSAQQQSGRITLMW